MLLLFQVLPVQLDSPQLANVCVFAEGKEDATAKGSVIWCDFYHSSVMLVWGFFFLSDFIIHWRVITHFVSIISWQAADASGVGQMGGFHRDEKTEEQNAGISSWAVQALSYAVRFLCYQMKTSSIMIFTIILVLPLFLFCSSVWSLWQTRLQHRRDLHILEDQAQKQRALTLKTRVRAWSNTPVNHMLILLSIVIIKITTITFFNTAPFKTKWQTTKCLRRIKSETT